MTEECVLGIEAERLSYHYRILVDAAAELSGVRHPHRVLEAYLLSTLGGVGARSGFALLLGPTEQSLHVIRRPVVDDPVLDRELGEDLRELLTATDRIGPFFMRGLPDSRVFAGYELLVVCPLEDGWYCVIGLGSPLQDGGYDDEAHDLLSGLAALLQTNLRFALFATKLEALNTELERRTEILDRQVYHLNALGELGREITPDAGMQAVLDSMLWNMLGYLSCPQGLAFVIDGSSLLVSMKGFVSKQPLEFETGRALVYRALSGLRNKHLLPMRPRKIKDLSILGEINGFEMERGYIFLLREHCYGLILLGPSMVSVADNLIFAFVFQAVLHLKSADSFATIATLNIDLEEQNRELRRTIAELTTARARISFLEATGKRIASVVHQKAEEHERVSWLDFALIIGLSLLLGVIFNAQSPQGIPLLEPESNIAVVAVSAVEAQNMLRRDNGLLIDARPREFYEQAHAQGALNLPAHLFDSVYAMQFKSEDPARPIVIYGRTISRKYDLAVARKFVARDHERVVVVEDEILLDTKGKMP